MTLVPMWLAVVPLWCHSGAMDLTTYVSNLGREFAALAEAGGEESRALVERLTGSLESAIRMTLLDALSAAADEITRDLAPGSVEVRLRGRDPQFVVKAPSGEAAAPEPAPAPAPEVEPVVAEDGPATRINVRMPEPLKAAIEEAAAKEGRSVNAWLVRAAAAGLQRSEPENRTENNPTTSKKSVQRFTGWVR
jgi:hypothetical protein